MTSSRLCLHCMSGYIHNGVCQNCGKPDSDMNRNVLALPYGFTLGQYRLGRVLGQGGFGITYHAWDTASNRPAALKEFFPVGCVYREQDGSLRVYPEKEQYFQHIRKRFQEEAQLIYRMRGHPEIIQIYSLFSSHGTVCYAMEYLDGQNLQDILVKEKKLEWNELEEPLWGALRSLSILHQNNLIHRDVSPDNIFLLNSGGSRLIDFGSVRNYRTSDHFTGIFKGSLAPLEMYNENARQGPWTDTFSFAATVYYLLSGGRLPAHVYDRLAAVEVNGVDSLVPLSEYAPHTPAHILRAVEHGLALYEDGRLQNVDEAQQAFFPGRYAIPVTSSVTESQYPKFQTGREKGQSVHLLCTSGVMKGRMFPMPTEQVLQLGRGSEGTLAIAYPPHTQGVSRRQCAFYRDIRDNVFVMDMDSRFGTFLDGRRLPPRVWRQAAMNQAVVFGGEEYRIVNF